MYCRARAIHCKPCFLLSGWGGAGAFSDGKLALSLEVGGWLNQYVSTEELGKLISYVDSVYLKFGATKHVYGTDIKKVEKDRAKSIVGCLKLRQNFRHMDAEKCPATLRKMREDTSRR